MPDDFDQGKFQGQVMSKLESIHDDLTALSKKVDKQDERIRALEIWKWILIGATSVGGVGSFASIAKAFL